jgi:uncharacterized membrane protein
LLADTEEASLVAALDIVEKASADTDSRTKAEIATLEKALEAHCQAAEASSALADNKITFLERTVELQKNESSYSTEKISRLEPALEASQSESAATASELRDALSATASDLRDISSVFLVIVVSIAILISFAVLHGLGLQVPCLKMNGLVAGHVGLLWILGKAPEAAIGPLRKDGARFWTALRLMSGL